ncbi:MAG: cobyric acid synthase [Deltaproteobacteria bacterium]|nr:cobyric acid synthase [Deltaproteobacteria bacterium]
MSKTLMIQGTASDVGKSLIVAGLCRIYKRKGISVAPFKAQNMALNSYVTPDGLEIGRAQALQAAAACLEPDVDMNPVLIKPHSDMSSQIVVMGKSWKNLHASDYYKSKSILWNHVTDSLDRMNGKYDLVICEGAGSPAEINLKTDEIVNMAVAKYLNAPVLLASDIDRGGVFASLYGTVELMDPDEKELIKGFIINKFRGYVDLLKPGLEMLENLTGGRKTAGVIPFIKNINLAQEDSVYLENNRIFGGGTLDIAVIHLPHISNFDDLDALLLEEGVTIRMVTNSSEIGYPDAVLIPGSKTTISDLKWMKDKGIDKTIIKISGEGTAVAGICGGYQILGRRICDPLGIEGKPEDIDGLGLLPIETVLTELKTTTRNEGGAYSSNGFLKYFSEKVTGYEIHMGSTSSFGEMTPLFKMKDGSTDGSVTGNGRIWGSYLHGIFNTPFFRRCWLKSIGWKETGEPRYLEDVQNRQLDHLADIMEENLDMDFINGIIGL